MPESHELVMLAAATLLWGGGGVILGRAALDRRAAVGRLATIVGEDPSAAASSTPVPRPSTGRSTLGSVRRVGTLVAAGLSLGAAAIHLAAGSAHVEVLGDVGLGFYWAAAFQAIFAAVLLSHPHARRVAVVGIGANLALLGAWAVSRTIGLPTVSGGPEVIGVADGITVILQALLVVLLVVRLRGLDARLVAARSASVVRSVATSGLVAMLGIIFLTTTIAMADATSGHGHTPGEIDDAHGHPALLVP